MTRQIRLFALLSLLLAGCGDTPSDPATDDLGTRLTADPEMRLGAIDDPEQSFNGGESVVIGPGGELVVADPQSNRIRVYGEDGRFLRAIGGPGSGPGHFERLMRVTLRGDTILAHDATGRVSAFSLDGSFQEVVWGPGEQWMFATSDPVLGRVVFMAREPGSLARDSSVIAQSNFGYPANITCETGEHGGVFRAPYLRLNQRGEIADTLYWKDVDVRRLIVDGEGASFTWWGAIAAEPQADFLPEGRGLLIAEESALDETTPPEIHLTALGAGRDTLWRRELPVRRVPITEEHFDLAIARTPPVALRNCGSGEVEGATPPTTAKLMDAYRATGRMPARLPALTGLHVGQDGSIWLRGAEEAADSIAWRVLDGAGEPKGFVRLPSGQAIVAARDDTFVTTETDELDVPYLIRYRLAGR